MSALTESMTEAFPPSTAPEKRLGYALLGMGAIGLVLTCVSYVLAGPAAALPGGMQDATASLAATQQAWPWMRAAGLVGMPSDVLLAVAAVLLAADAFKRGQALDVAAWVAMALASALFVVVDAMVAFVLPSFVALVSVPGALPSYVGQRALFDVLFAIGTWTAGLAAVALAWTARGDLFHWPLVGWGMRLAGVVCLTSSTLYLIAQMAAPLIGPGIALVAFAAIGLAMAGRQG